MGFELPNGKTARNLQDQVKFLSEKLKDLYAAFNDSGLKKIVIVEELPEVGDPTVLYLLAKEDPEEGNYYDEYLWYDNQWEQIGTTKIDLSNYVDLTSEQTITGVKTFISSGFKINNVPFSGSDANLNYVQIGNIAMYLNSNNYITANFRPSVNGAYDLGSSDNKWKDLYLSNSILIGSTSIIKNDEYGNLTLSCSNGTICFTHNIRPTNNNANSIGSSAYRYNTVYSYNISDGTYSATVEALVKKSHLYTHNIICSNGTLVLIGSFSAFITSQSSLSMAEASAVKMIWNNNTVLQIVNGTTIYYFDTSDSTIKTVTIGTFTSDTIMDY